MYRERTRPARPSAVDRQACWRVRAHTDTCAGPACSSHEPLLSNRSKRAVLTRARAWRRELWMRGSRSRRASGVAPGVASGVASGAPAEAPHQGPYQVSDNVIPIINVIFHYWDAIINVIFHYWGCHHQCNFPLLGCRAHWHTGPLPGLRHFSVPNRRFFVLS